MSRSKKICTDDLMKNFMSPVEDQTSSEEKDTVHKEETTHQQTNKKVKKNEKSERTKPITFCMPESVNSRLMKYIFTKKLAGEKITVTQMLNESIVKYMDELGIEE